MRAKGYRGEWLGQGKARHTWRLGRRMDHFVSLPLSSRSLSEDARHFKAGRDNIGTWGRDAFSGGSMEVGWIGIEREYAV